MRPLRLLSGPTPPFLASGVDPRVLLLLPWRVRHAAATAPNAADVLAWIEQYRNEPDAEQPSEGLDAYISRMCGWAGRAGIVHRRVAVSATTG